MTDDEIVRACLDAFADEEPADPQDETAWHLSDQDISRLLMLAIEHTMEREDFLKKIRDQRA